MDISIKKILTRITFVGMYKRLIFYCAVFCVISIYFIHTKIRETIERNVCLKELQIGQTLEALNVTSGNKQDIIEQFLLRYNVDLGQNVSRLNGGSIASDWMTCFQVTPDHCEEMGVVLKWLSTVPITRILVGVDGETGTSWAGRTSKLDFRLKGGYRALFKPKKFEIAKITGDLSRLQMGGDRYNAEIASFHLQRILGFNRAPIVVGRKVDIFKELLSVIGRDVVKSIYKKDMKTCLRVDYGHVNADFCGEDGFLEGALVLWLPRPIDMIHIPSPLKNQTRSANPWHEIERSLNGNKQRILDYIDMLVLDYLIQNIDRTKYFATPSYLSALLILDQGKGFTNPNIDFKTALTTFKQKCQIRPKTYERLKQLRGGVLSQVLGQIISRDPLAPILVTSHLTALDRRLEKVLLIIEDCISTHGLPYVFPQKSTRMLE